MKTIFWNVDTLNDFMYKKGRLYVQDAEEIIPNLERLTRYAEKNKIKILNSADRHTKDSEEVSETPDFATTFPLHCEIGTKGAEFILETKPKKPYDIFYHQKTLEL